MECGGCKTSRLAEICQEQIVYPVYGRPWLIETLASATCPLRMKSFKNAIFLVAEYHAQPSSSQTLTPYHNPLP